jgi:MFS superfamily sulfate permease-like transporter
VDPDKVKAIVGMERPDDISGIRRFLGMVNHLNTFSPKITELTKPLRELLKVDNAWIWDTAHENAFYQIKHELASSGKLSHYIRTKKALLQRMHHHLIFAQLLGRNEAKV